MSPMLQAPTRPQSRSSAGSPLATETPVDAKAKLSSGNTKSVFLFSPLIDLLFICNIAWPLVLLFDFFGNIETHERLLFWQIFFITSPHRWITLMLVTMDDQRTAGREVWFIALGVTIFATCLVLNWGTGSLLCLGAIDYVWNAWHFSSQHHGVFRIYQRRCGDSTAPLMIRLQRILFRGFLLYVIARVAGWGWREGGFPGWESVRDWDAVVMIVPVAFLVLQIAKLVRQPKRYFASSAYLLSVLILFSALLAAAHTENTKLVIQLALASAIFHSVEYLSIVTWSVEGSKSRTTISPGLRGKMFVKLTKSWLAFLAIFIVVIGASNYFLSRGYFEFWVLVNLGVAFCHYLYDGMIWQSPRSVGQQPTGISTGATTSSSRERVIR